MLRRRVRIQRRLTDAGLTRLQQAYPTHLVSVRRHIMEHLGDIDLAPIAHALQHFGTAAQAPRGPSTHTRGTPGG
jgi:hypothetical protein